MKFWEQIRNNILRITAKTQQKKTKSCRKQKKIKNKQNSRWLLNVVNRYYTLWMSLNNRLFSQISFKLTATNFHFFWQGLALINGTQMITALGAEAVDRCELIAKQADVVAALSLEVLKGSSRAFDSDVHQLRPHTGQINVARRLRSLLHSEAYPSAIAESHRFCDRVQDAYTLRCCPQVCSSPLKTISVSYF